jgi:hypothetical protein
MCEKCFLNEENGMKIFCQPSVIEMPLPTSQGFV